MHEHERRGVNRSLECRELLRSQLLGHRSGTALVFKELGLVEEDRIVFGVVDESLKPLRVLIDDLSFNFGRCELGDAAERTDVVWSTCQREEQFCEQFVRI